MAPQTIGDVISALDTIVQQAHDNASRLGYFAALYRRVTRAVRDGLSSGRFRNGPLLEKLDVVFALRYLDAFATFQSGGAVTRSWDLAFRGCGDGHFLILQQLLAGMNAHISLDLGIATAQICPASQLPELKPDFDEINNLLDEEVGAVEAKMAAVSPLIGDLERIGLRSETSIINFSIPVARDNAWLIAQRLASEPSSLHGVSIDALDLAVSVKGRAILYPLVGREGLKIIQDAEVKDIRRVIEVLSQSGTDTQAASANSGGATLEGNSTY